MAGPLTYAAVALLARDRLQQIIDTLRAKKELGPTRELELHVLHLAEQAHAALSAAQPTIEPPVRLYGPPLTDGVSRFALLGVMGPDLMRYAFPFAAGQRWVYDTLHKGTPDANREPIYAESTNLVFDFWRRVAPLIEAELPARRREAATANMRAYVIGHLCHIATDVVAHPWLDREEARLGEPGLARLSREQLAGALDRRIANEFFNRDTATRGKWADWFPSPGDVPNVFAKAMAAAIVARYGARPPGLPSFEETFTAIDPPPPEADAVLVDDAVSSFRSVLEIGRVWGLGEWIGVTAAMFLPLIAAYPLALTLSRANDLTVELTGPEFPVDAQDTRRYELATFPFAMTALGPLVTMIVVSASGRGLRAEGATGWAHAGLQLACAVGFFASLGGAGAARWTLLFALPLVASVAQIIFVLARSGAGNLRTLLWLGPLVGIGLALLFLLCWATFLHEGIEEFQKPSDERDHLKAWGFLAIWGGMVLALWVIHALLWRYVFSDQLPEDPHRFAGPDGPIRYLHLYDDATLIREPGAPLDAVRLGTFIYPTTRRPLLKLWFDAPADEALRVRIDHDRIVFTTSVADPPAAADTQIVFVPVATTSVDDFGALLAATVRDSGGATGKLRFEPFRDDEKALELAPGFTLSDHGDDRGLQVEHDAEAQLFKPIGHSEADAFVLYHAPRYRLATAMGRRGPARLVTRAQADAVPGSTLSSRAAPDDRTLDASDGTAGESPLLRRLFQPGDVVSTTSGTIQSRIVEAIPSENELVVSSPFDAPLVDRPYHRSASDFSVSVPAPGGSQLFTPQPAIGIGPNDVRGTAGTVFGALLRAGDTILIDSVSGTPPVPTPQLRRVVRVRDATPTGPAGTPTPLLELDAPLAPVVPDTAPVAYERVAEEDAEGFAFFADEDDRFGHGASIMNDAADLAVLFALAGASRTAANDAPAQPAAATTRVHKVYEVFRNWNLDRRRVNEWKALVGGHAFSEKRGDLRAADDAAPIDRGDDYTEAPAGFMTRRAAGEALANELGWLNVFRGWIEMAGRPSNDIARDEVFRPGQPTNRALTRAMAFLLDARDPAMP